MKVRYLLRNKARYHDYIPLICRISHRGVSEFNTGLLIREQHWDHDKQRDKRDKINVKIKLITQKIMDVYNEHADSSWTSTDILNQMEADHSPKFNWPDLFSAHDQHQAVVKSSAKYTRDRYMRCMRYLIEDIPNISINYLKRSHISLFYQALRSRGISNNMAVKYISLLSSVIEYGNYMDLIDIKNPCKGHQFKLEEVETVYLDHAELGRLEHKDLSMLPRLEQVRDVFVFQCYTGMEYSRVVTLHMQQIKKDAQGDLWIESTRQKTGVKIHIYLYPEAKAILNRYSCYQDEHGGKALPVSSNQHMNAYLQELCTICQIDKKLTTHKARHTFATTVLLDRGVSMESVKNQLGHRSIKTTESVYGKITRKRIKDESLKVLKDHYSTEEG